MRLEGHATRPEQVPGLMAALGEAEAYRGRRFRTLELRLLEDVDGASTSRRLRPGSKASTSSRSAER
ncbi:MAG: hypothetical protein U5K43_04980 [Halofilum sp. (in: g-proteobacteria)]|nr:hypothetical protein [Halofilum sp. (in: g-proteobacteria)]